MGDISKHFNREEFSCNCGCGFSTVDKGTLKLLEEVREHFDQPVIVTSGCRCPEYNRKVGGASKSKHVEGLAADIQVIGVEAKEVFDFLDGKYPNQYGLGSYSSFTHVDARPHKARWGG